MVININFSALNQESRIKYLEIKCSKRSLILYQNSPSDIFELIKPSNYQMYGFFHHKSTNTYYLPFLDDYITQFIDENKEKYSSEIDRTTSPQEIDEFYEEKFCEFMAKLSRHAYGTYIIRSIDLTDDDNMVKISHLDTSDSVVKNYETIAPVMKNYETINFPVVKSTAKTSDSVVKSTTETSDPVVKPTTETSDPVVKPTTETSAPTIKSEIDTQAIFESLVMMEQCLANIRSTLKIPRSYRYHPNWRNDPDNCPPVGSDQWKEFRQRDLTNAVEFVTAYHARVDQ